MVGIIYRRHTLCSKWWGWWWWGGGRDILLGSVLRRCKRKCALGFQLGLHQECCHRFSLLIQAGKRAYINGFYTTPPPPKVRIVNVVGDGIDEKGG